MRRITLKDPVFKWKKLVTEQSRHSTKLDILEVPMKKAIIGVKKKKKSHMKSCLHEDESSLAKIYLGIMFGGKSNTACSFENITTVKRGGGANMLWV